MKLEIEYKTGATPITFEQAAMFLTEADIEAGEKRGAIKTVGPWQNIKSYRAIAVAHDFNSKLIIYGERALSNATQSGYQLEGRVSVEGKSRRGFTSSMLFKLPSGRLVSVAVIYACCD